MAVASNHNSELVARRWAKALMDLAQEDGGISKEEILSNLNDIAQTIEGSKELSDLVNNPSVSVEEKQIVICKLFQNRVMPVVYNFLFSLNLKKRLNIIGEIAQEFRKELEEMKNIVRVDVTSAIELNDERKNDIRNRIADKLQKDVIVNWGVDSDIIGGLVLNINETIVDNSIRHRLENLSKNIVK